MNNNCNCSDATVCTELPPVVSAAKLLTLNSANCQRTLVPRPGSLVYSDGTEVIYADGSAAAPLALPGLVNYRQLANTPIPSIVSWFSGGVLTAVQPDAGVDGLVLTSLAGEWSLQPIPANLCFDAGDVQTECCCPAAFAVWVEDNTDPENPQLCLRSFNFCEDATNITSGSIMSCEPDTGCIRKLVGTSSDQVPVWNQGGQAWVPTEISDLIPTPESVLDISQFRWNAALNEGNIPAGGDLAEFMAGTGAAWTFNQSGTLVNSVSYASGLYTHNSIQILAAGFYQVTFVVTGELRSIDNAIDPSGFAWTLTVIPSINNASISQVPAPLLDQPATAIGLANVGNFDTLIKFGGSGSFALNASANARLSFTLILRGYNTNTLEEFLSGEITVDVSGTITRIT